MRLGGYPLQRHPWEVPGTCLAASAGRWICFSAAPPVLAIACGSQDSAATPQVTESLLLEAHGFLPRFPRSSPRAAPGRPGRPGGAAGDSGPVEWASGDGAASATVLRAATPTGSGGPEGQRGGEDRGDRTRGLGPAPGVAETLIDARSSRTVKM